MNEKEGEKETDEIAILLQKIKNGTLGNASTTKKNKVIDDLIKSMERRIVGVEELLKAYKDGIKEVKELKEVMA